MQRATSDIILIILLLSVCVFFCDRNPSIDQCQDAFLKSQNDDWRWSFYSSNPSKHEEFERFFALFSLPLDEIRSFNIREIDSDEISVITHKASQIEKNGVLVEDSSLIVEGADIGINLKWKIDQIEGLIGKNATLVTHMAYKEDDLVLIYKAEVEGKIVIPRGQAPMGFKLNRFFQPKGSDKTLAENNADHFNPRYLAFLSFVRGEIVACRKVMKDWNGKFQLE